MLNSQNRVVVWIKGLIARIPRPAWQIGLLWGDGEVQWNPVGSEAIAIVFSQGECDDEIATYNENIVAPGHAGAGGSIAVYRKIWISPAKVNTFDIFNGW